MCLMMNSYKLSSLDWGGDDVLVIIVVEQGLMIFF
jgi:hypothetical protein